MSLRAKSIKDALVFITFGNERSRGAWAPSSVFLHRPDDPPLATFSVTDNGDEVTITASTPLTGDFNVPGTQMGGVMIDVDITAECHGVVRS